MNHFQALAAGGVFVDPRFIRALGENNCIGPGTGWNPVQGIDAPAFLKTHSHGEFVFDGMWAQAAQQAGIRWYPKLLIAAPFTPVTGPRLCLTELSVKRAQATLSEIEDYCKDSSLSNAGINFCSALDREALDSSDWLARFDWQFHWENKGYRDFDDFLATLKSKPRKNIKAERRKAHDQGWQFRWLGGQDLDEPTIKLAYQCYQTTHALYGNHIALSLGFFTDIARELGEQFLVCVANINDRDLAAAIFFKDSERLYGRYWGSLIETKDVHFEVCYYQGIDYCIHHGLKWFEPGAQGEHKIKRGFLPQATHSYHWFASQQLKSAVGDYLVREKAALMAYRDDLASLNPYTE